MNNFGNSAPRGRRAAPRAQVPLVVELSIEGDRHSAILAEISRTGAKLSGLSALANGQEVVFRAGRVQAPAAVVWFDGDQCAIEFDMPIAAKEVNRLRSLANFVKSVNGR